MSRLSDAWGVLCDGLPEPEVREVEVPVWVSDVSLYFVERRRTYFDMFCEELPGLHTYHPNCAAAFACIPADRRGEAVVTEIPCVQIGSRYFRKSSEIIGVGVKPDPKNAPKAKIKPKRAKGAK